MTQQRLTQCPHCKASFKVSEEQLSAANGRVRCGACMNVFDAIAYSISTADDLALPDTKEPAELEKDILADEDLFADNPEEDQQDESYSGSKLTDEFSTSFLELDEADNSNDPYSTSFKKIEDDFISQEDVDESWTKDILEDLDENAGGKKEPKLSATRFEEEILAEPPANTFDDIDPAAKKEKQPRKPHTYEKVEFQYQQDPTHSRHWFLTFLFVVVNLVLLATLLAQASWYHYEKLARYPKIAELYEHACKEIGCTLPKLEDIKKIKSQNLVVRSHPTAHKSLIIDSIIVNKASFEQDFPDIALYFSDINKITIAQRLLSPSDYLSGDLLDWSKMPVDQPIHISLEIVDPGKEAVNYNLEFFPHTPK